MSGPLPIMSMADVRANVLVSLIAARDRADAQMVLLLMSISEYLKDAERWHFFMQNGPVLNDVSEMTPVELLKFVDKEIENERERVVRPRKRRVDGVSGNQGG